MFGSLRFDEFALGEKRRWHLFATRGLMCEPFFEACEVCLLRESFVQDATLEVGESTPCGTRKHSTRATKTVQIYI